MFDELQQKYLHQTTFLSLNSNKYSLANFTRSHSHIGRQRPNLMVGFLIFELISSKG